MNQEEYRQISSRLNDVGDIKSVAAEVGIPEEVALIIYTQRVTRDATKRFYVVKNQISRIAAQYDRGVPLVQLAQRLRFPPVLLAYLLFLHKGVPRKRFWEYIRRPESAGDARTRRELRAAVERDLVYSPRGEELQRRRGQEGERRLFEWLDRRGIKYMTEKDLKRFKDQYTKTPDVLFMKPMVIKGRRVSWIESKANFGDLVELKRNLRKQLLPYVKLFGSGIVVYWFGFVSDVEAPPGITLVDGTFFSESGGAGEELRSADAQCFPAEAIPRLSIAHGPRAPPPPSREDYYGE
ncbi:MAG: TPD domain-containing protein [Thermoplasmatota archaeon]